MIEQASGDTGRTLSRLGDGERAQALSRLAGIWRDCLVSAPAGSADLARSVLDHTSGYADVFYTTLLSDPRAARFLSQEQVRERLHPGLQSWLRDLLNAGPEDVDAQISTNLHVGVVHARIGIPVDLVNRGTRLLRAGMLERLAASDAPRELAFAAASMVNYLLDLALECMTLAYADAQEHTTRADAAYRLFSLAHNLGTERERQRALLLEWENNLLYAMAGGGTTPMPGALAESEFGLWLLHKGIPIVGDNQETRHVLRLMAEVDELLGPGGEGTPAMPEPGAVWQIRKRLGTMQDLLASLLGRMSELEAGADTLTRLLTRRFLPTVLRREIELAATHGHVFSLVVVDMDHFKAINDRHGHAVGDRVLQHVAGLLTHSVRSSDYVFRMGGEEFLVVLVGAGRKQAAHVAEQLRKRISEQPLHLDDNEHLQLSASLGVAVYDGHPDYERMLARADRAMYEAKQNGRNRVEIG